MAFGIVIIHKERYCGIAYICSIIWKKLAYYSKVTEVCRTNHAEDGFAITSIAILSLLEIIVLELVPLLIDGH